MEISRFSPRLAIWLVVITVLTMYLMLAVEKVQPEAEEVAYAVAARRMLDRANYYKEHWLVGGTPHSLQITNQTVWFDRKGWPLPLRDQDGNTDCEHWLELLYPDKEIFSMYPDYHNESTSSGYQCRYRYKNKKSVVIRLQKGKFSVSVEYH